MMSVPVSKAHSAGRVLEKRTDVRVSAVDLYLLPVRTRVPLKFGPETLTSVTCARACVQVQDRLGHTASGWGETPMSVQWAWPSTLSVEKRFEDMLSFCQLIASQLASFEATGHPLEIGHDFAEAVLPGLRQSFNDGRSGEHRLPLLASLVCLSPFDLALHDAYGKLHGVPIYDTYNAEWMNRDLAAYLESAEDSRVCFGGLFPQDFLIRRPPQKLPAWHLVAGLDPLENGDRNGEHPDDGLPVVLTDWIERDGLFCLKVKLRGNDAAWDYDRLLRVGRISLRYGVRHLSADFNCTVTEPAYVSEILDRLAAEAPEISSLLLYIEQPFPYELEENPVDVHSLSRRKPLYMDESAHSWRQVRLGRKLGWTGVALKTCKTQTGALLSLCWSKAHGMDLMVQDLTNPMLAQIPHVLLAAYAGTVMGVETNAMQFYPEASTAEAAIHPGLFARIDGHVDLSTLKGPGFGYNGAESGRELSLPAASTKGRLQVVPGWHIRAYERGPNGQ